MSAGESSIDAESQTRNKKYNEADHLRHLLNIGYNPESVLIKNFVEQHHLQQLLAAIIKKN